MLVIARAKNPNKDQSYFVNQIQSGQLPKILFPIGEFQSKEDVRQYADSKGLITSSKPDSQGLCFVGQTSLRELLTEVLGKKEGNIVTIMSIEEFHNLGFNTTNNFKKSRLEKLNKQNERGQDLYNINLGSHDGAFLFTIGQRQNLGLSNGPWIVEDIDIDKNIVTVVHKTKENQSYIQELLLSNLNWQIDISAKEFPVECLAQVRYRSKAVKCRIDFINDSQGLLQVTFDQSIKSPAKGQSVVFYEKFQESLHNQKNTQKLSENQNSPSQYILGSGIIKQIKNNIPISLSTFTKYLSKSK